MIYSIEEEIKRLRHEAYEGNIPTWYAFQEIDRLKAMQGKQDG